MPKACKKVFRIFNSILFSLVVFGFFFKPVKGKGKYKRLALPILSYIYRLDCGNDRTNSSRISCVLISIKVILFRLKLYLIIIIITGMCPS